MHVIVVTGRMVQSVRRALEPAGLDDPVVCYQGAVVADSDGTWLRHEPIPLELAREAIALLDGEGYSPNVYVGDELYVGRSTPGSREYATYNHIDLHVVGDMLGWLEGPPTKLVCVGGPGCARRGRAAREVSVRRADVHLEVPGPFPRVRSTGRDQGRRSRLPRSTTRLHTRRTVAFGDGENDVELLEWAGYSVAVENAHPRVKAVADWICPSAKDEAVAQVLESFLDSKR